MTTSGAAKKLVPIPPRGVDYRGKVVLAPMVRSGELPSRLLALHYGADLVWGPETVDHAMVGATRRVNPRTGMVEFTRPPSANQARASAAEESVVFRLDPAREAGRLVFQVGTGDPARAVAAARLVAADVSGIDVNAGCPKPFSTHGGMGAALLRDPDRLCAILDALVAELSAPPHHLGVSVKIRLLETPAATEALVRRLVATGITGLTVHCRTTPMRPRERAIRAQLRMVGDVCREAGVACLMNGDVQSRDEAARLVEEYGVDGAMIATAAERNPSCFRAAAGDNGGQGVDERKRPAAAAAAAPWRDMVQRYLRFAMETENKLGGTKFTLNHIVPGREAVFRRLAQCKSYVALCEAFGWQSELGEMARAADEVLGLTPKAMAVAAAEAERHAEEKRQARKRKRMEESTGGAAVPSAMARPGKKPATMGDVLREGVDRAVNGLPRIMAAI